MGGAPPGNMHTVWGLLGELGAMVFQKFLRYFSQIFDLFSAEIPRTFLTSFSSLTRPLVQNLGASI